MASNLISAIGNRVSSSLETSVHFISSLSAGPLSFSRLDTIAHRLSREPEAHLQGFAAAAISALAFALSGFSITRPITLALLTAGTCYGTTLLRDRITTENFDPKLDQLQKDIEHAVRYQYFETSKTYFADRIAHLVTNQFVAPGNAWIPRNLSRPDLMRNPERALRLDHLCFDAQNSLNQNPQEAMRALRITSNMDAMQESAYQAKTVPQKRQMDRKHSALLQDFQTLPYNIRSQFSCTLSNFCGFAHQFKETVEEALHYEVYAKDGWDFLERVLERPVRGLPNKAIEDAVKDCCARIQKRYGYYLTNAAACSPQMSHLLEKMAYQLQMVEKITGVPTQETVTTIQKAITEIRSSELNGVFPSFYIWNTREEALSLADLITLCSQKRGTWADSFASHESIQKRIKKSTHKELREFITLVTNSSRKPSLLKTFFRYADSKNQRLFFEMLPYGSLGDVLACLPEDLIELDLSSCSKSLRDHHLLFLTKKHFPKLKKLNLEGCSALSEKGLKTFVSAPGMSRLETLNLQGCAVSDVVVKELADNPSRVYLKELHISRSTLSNHITDASLDALASSLYLWDLETLSLEDCARITDQGICQLAASKKMSCLKNLNLSGCALLTNSSLQGIAASPHMAHLEGLTFAHCPLIGNEGVLAIANSPYMGRLSRLALLNNPLLTDLAIQGIANSPHMGSLSEFGFAGCPLIGNASIVAIAGSPRMRSLKGLIVSSPLITDASAQSIAGSEHMGSLENLALYNSQLITDTSFQTISRSAYLSKMKKLRMSNCPLLTDASIQAIAGSASMNKLEGLDASNCPLLTDASMQAIAKSERMRGLKSLFLWGTRVTDVGAAALAKSPFMSNLQALNLSLCRVQDGGVKALAESEYLQNLESFLLSDNQLTDAAAESIAASPHMRSIRELDFSGSEHMRDRGIRALAQSLYLDSLRTLRMNRTHIDFRSPLHFAANRKNVTVKARESGVHPFTARWVSYVSYPVNGVIET